jgi:hypothetical protein
MGLPEFVKAWRFKNVSEIAKGRTKQTIEVGVDLGVDGRHVGAVFERHIERLKQYINLYSTASGVAENCCDERFMGLHRFVKLYSIGATLMVACADTNFRDQYSMNEEGQQNGRFMFIIIGQDASSKKNAWCHYVRVS